MCLTNWSFPVVLFNSVDGISYGNALKITVFQSLWRTKLPRALLYLISKSKSTYWGILALLLTLLFISYYCVHIIYSRKQITQDSYYICVNLWSKAHHMRSRHCLHCLGLSKFINV